MMSASRSKRDNDHLRADVSPTNAVALACGAVAPVIFSGIQPTGRKDLGSHIGAITQYVTGQDRGDPAIYCIVRAGTGDVQPGRPARRLRADRRTRIVITV
jgi:hypothetical protein